jgi:hypothetical protein
VLEDSTEPQDVVRNEKRPSLLTCQGDLRPCHLLRRLLKLLPPEPRHHEPRSLQNGFTTRRINRLGGCTRLLIPAHGQRKSSQ